MIEVVINGHGVVICGQVFFEIVRDCVKQPMTNHDNSKHPRTIPNYLKPFRTTPNHPEPP
ncbi:hypothetical protein FHS68_004261 [Dyadobacter arcticus]|uniref:Uncharacterized protein n=1 Tax=Dyadobacter arcticus TaxID=1078754 RepID=A0ABX0UT29_9BACT|nr:hypothetical protein [Dyadobacter arcticus]